MSLIHMFYDIKIVMDAFSYANSHQLFVGINRYVCDLKKNPLITL